MSMPTLRNRNPFQAGPGGPPPYFAGREEEIEAISAALDSIEGGAGPMGRSPDPVLVLVGPQGVGKTVVTTLAIKDAQSRYIHAARISPDLLSGPQETLVNNVFETGMLKSSFDKIGSPRFSFMRPGVTFSLEDAERDFTLAVHLCLTERPLLLVLDDAHHCEPEVLNFLFHIIQDCMSEELPLAVVMAGTPGIVQLFRRCDPIFWLFVLLSG